MCLECVLQIRELKKSSCTRSTLEQNLVSCNGTLWINVGNQFLRVDVSTKLNLSISAKKNVCGIYSFIQSSMKIPVHKTASCISSIQHQSFLVSPYECFCTAQMEPFAQHFKYLQTVVLFGTGISKNFGLDLQKQLM
jgi:ribosomal protein L28